MGVWLGLGAFALFFISDYNDWKKGLRALRFCFPLGALLLAAGTVLEAGRGSPLVRGWVPAAVLVLGAVFFALLIYTLFFALPVEASYAGPGKKRPPAPRGSMPCAGTRGYCGSPGSMGACGPGEGCRFGRRCSFPD